MTVAARVELTYQRRLDALRAKKVEHTQEKLGIVGSMDFDDHALILPPPDRRKVVQTVSGSGQLVADVQLDGLELKSNHADGNFYGPKLCGENFRTLLETHPTYIDPTSSLAGAYMVNFYSCHKSRWKPECDYSHLREEQEKYQLGPGIGAWQHFCQDLTIGLELGWEGILDKIHRCRRVNGPEAAGFYDGLEHVALGIQNWIRRNAEAAGEMAEREASPQLRENLEEMAGINERLATDPPRTFREACQWMVWYQMAARMYNGSGSLGRLDVLLTPFYVSDTAAGILTDDEAIFHIACLLLRDTGYIQLGGLNEDGFDVTSRVSYLVLEAIDRLRIPSNVGVCVGDGVDPGLLRRGVEIQLRRKMGFPKFLGISSTTRGFARNGYPIKLANTRAYSGCHWSAIPGREYTLNDCVKVNFGPVFDVALREMMANGEITPSVRDLWEHFVKHLRRAIEVIAEGLDFHMEHQHETVPELVLDLLSHGPIEKGLDASHGGVEFYNLCVDGAALATVADSFAALEQRIEREERLTWKQLVHHLDTDWAGPDGERTRLMMKGVPHYGSGGSRADEYAVRIAKTFADLVAENPTPAGFNMIPGLFSWARMFRPGANRPSRMVMQAVTILVFMISSSASASLLILQQDVERSRFPADGLETEFNSCIKGG